MAAVESELHTLYNTLNKYKMLIAANLDEIDESVSRFNITSLLLDLNFSDITSCE
jgi:hypothetical protein